MSTPHSLHAVITGDIVGSTKLPSESRRNLSGWIRETYDSAQQALPEVLPFPLSITGGDGWQCYVEAPRHALRVGVYMRAGLRQHEDVDSRLAIAVDTVDFIPDGRLNEADGAAFRRSGRELQRLSKSARLRLFPPAASSDSPADVHVRVFVQGTFVSTGYLADEIVSGWTEAQAQAITLALSAPPGVERTHQEIADLWQPEPIDRSAVTRHLQRADWNKLLDVIGLYEETVDALCEWYAGGHNG